MRVETQLDCGKGIGDALPNGVQIVDRLMNPVAIQEYTTKVLLGAKIDLKMGGPYQSSLGVFGKQLEICSVCCTVVPLEGMTCLTLFHMPAETAKEWKLVPPAW